MMLEETHREPYDNSMATGGKRQFEGSWKSIKKALLKSYFNSTWMAALLDYLRNQKDEPEVREEVRQSVDFRFLSQLMVAYNATTSMADLMIFESLVLLEKTYKVNLGIIYPLLWSERSVEIYSKRDQFGTTLNSTSPDQILEFLDGLLMWKTVLHHSRSSLEESGDALELYDIRFLLRLFLSLMHAGSELKYRVFIEKNGLSLAFSCTSSKDPVIRRLAYCVLQKFLSLLQELDVDAADDRVKVLYVYILRLFKQSIESDAPRLPHVISHFFARVSKLILHPESPVFNAVLSFLSLKPIIDFKNVPELYKLLLSSSTNHHNQEREWILTLISEALIEPMDYNVLQNRCGIKLLLSLFPTCMVDMVARRLILNTLKAAVQMPSVAHDLFYRMNLHSWIASVIDNPLLNAWEQCYLGQVYSILIANERKHQRDSSVESPEYLFNVANITAQMATKKVLCAMESFEDKKIAIVNIQSILATLGAKWRPKKRKVQHDYV